MSVSPLPLEFGVYEQCRFRTCQLSTCMSPIEIVIENKYSALRYPLQFDNRKVFSAL